MYYKKMLWLLCATVLASQPSYAKEASAQKDHSKLPASMVPRDAKQAQPAEKVTLNQVISIGLRQSPQIKAFAAGVAMAEGENKQAGALINPELGVEVENVAGGGPYKGTDGAEITFGASQTIELGGKVSARKAIAGKGLEIANLEHQAIALDLVRDITIAYASFIEAEENVRIATEQKELAEDVLKSVSKRVGAAAAPLIQKNRAEVERSIASVALDKATREHVTAQKNLSVLLGVESFEAALDTEPFFALKLPITTQAEEILDANPDLLKLNSTLAQAGARLTLEQANAIPDPRINVGIRDFRDTGDQAFILGVSVPLPVMNSNQGNIEKARSDFARAEHINKQKVLDIKALLTSQQQVLENSYVEAETIRTEMLPAAEKAFKLAREGYELGRFPYLEVLDAQRSLFAVKQQYIFALKEYHVSLANVERLAAVHLPKLKNIGEFYAQ